MKPIDWEVVGDEALAKVIAETQALPDEVLRVNGKAKGGRPRGSKNKKLRDYIGRKRKTPVPMKHNPFTL
jgi:hypothetical protein